MLIMKGHGQIMCFPRTPAHGLTCGCHEVFKKAPFLIEMITFWNQIKHTHTHAYKIHANNTSGLGYYFWITLCMSQLLFLVGSRNNWNCLTLAERASLKGYWRKHRMTGKVLTTAVCRKELAAWQCQSLTSLQEGLTDPWPAPENLALQYSLCC